MTSALASMPSLTAWILKSSKQASICARRKSSGGTCTAVTPRVFCAVSAAMAERPCTWCAANVLRSACMPAPPPESEPAMVRAETEVEGLMPRLCNVWRGRVLPARLLCPLVIQHVAQAGDAGQQRRGKQCVVLPTRVQPGADTATGKKTGDDQAAECQAPHRQWQAAQQVAQADAQVGEHAAEVGGAYHCAAEGGRHRILQSAGGGCGKCAPQRLLPEQGNGQQQQSRFQGQRDAITTTDLQGAVLDAHATA